MILSDVKKIENNYNLEFSQDDLIKLLNIATTLQQKIEISYYQHGARPRYELKVWNEKLKEFLETKKKIS